MADKYLFLYTCIKVYKSVYGTQVSNFTHVSVTDRQTDSKKFVLARIQKKIQ